MGYNTVAVLQNDCSKEISESGEFGKRLAYAMGSFSERGARHIPGAFIASQDHASGFQVVIVHGNFGWLASDSGRDEMFAKDYGWQALNAMKECLERNGYRISKKRKPRESKGFIDASE